MSVTDTARASTHIVVRPWQPAPGLAPDDTNLFAIGDVHGCLSQLEALLDHLKLEIGRLQERGRKAELIMLGDYVDRGPSSVGVLRLLDGIEARMGVPVTRLLGNHDLMLREAAGVDPEPSAVQAWLWSCGHAIFAEMGLEMPRSSRASLAAFAAKLRAGLGTGLIRLLNGLKVHHRAGDYLFVHGGVDPQRPFDEHGIDDLVWMREPFLSGIGWSHPFVAVHGHTILPREVLPHRIAVDSGCFTTGVLTAVELADDRLRHHQASDDPEFRRYEAMFRPHAR